MGGCRCVYRNCESSTATTPGLHYFHFPVRDVQRCEKWIQNARKPAFRTLDRDKLRNKVVCSLHFEERCFTNTKQDRLVHNAVPTLGHVEYVCDDTLPTIPSPINDDDNNILLIPIDENNTKFALPDTNADAEFDGMSYTIFDDAVIPTSKIQEVIIRELENQPNPTVLKDSQFKQVVKKIKTNITSKRNKKDKIKHTAKIISTTFEPKAEFYEEALENNENNFEIETIDDKTMIRTELMLNSENNDIPSYSVSTTDGNVSVEPTPVTHILPDLITETIENEENNEQTSTNETNSNISSEKIPIPVTLVQNKFNINNQQKNNESNSDSSYTINKEKTSKEPETNLSKKSKKPTNDNEDCDPYISMIKTNRRQIKQLKKIVYKQTKFNRYLWQRKQMPHFKRKFNRTAVIESLKDHLKPSLLAILKFELLPQEDVVLTDNEEKFITDLYTENPECYNLLRTKFEWNLPSTSCRNEENMTCD